LARVSFMKSARAKAQNNSKLCGAFLRCDMGQFYSVIDNPVLAFFDAISMDHITW